jgi:hypothetical protein
MYHESPNVWDDWPAFMHQARLSFYGPGGANAMKGGDEGMQMDDDDDDEASVSVEEGMPELSPAIIVIRNPDSGTIATSCPVSLYVEEEEEVFMDPPSDSSSVRERIIPFHTGDPLDYSEPYVKSRQTSPRKGRRSIGGPSYRRTIRKER